MQNAARLLSAVDETVSRYKGRQSAKAVEKDFRHFVDMVVPPGGLGNRLDAMYEFQTARQLKHFRAPRFAFASVFTRASDGGIQGTVAKLKARPRWNPANIFRSKYFNSLCRWRANGVRRLPCQSLTNAHLEMMLYIPGAGGAGHLWRLSASILQGSITTKANSNVRRAVALRGALSE